MIKPFGAKAARFIRRPPEQDALLNILNGAIRSSKTWAVNAKLISLLSQGFWPGGTGLITGASKTTVRTNMLNDIFAIVTEKRYRYNAQSGELILCGRPFLVCGAKDEGSWKFIRGATVGLWIADELTLYPQSFFDMAVSRLSLPMSRMYGTTNPATPYHYLKSEWLDNSNKRTNGDIWSEDFTLEDNPNITEDKKESFRRMFTGVFYERNIRGLWVVAEGAIYRDALSEANYYDETTVPIGLRGTGGHIEKWIAIDFGTVNSLCALEIYDDGETAWVDREYYWDSRKQNRQKTNAEYADDLLAMFFDPNDRRSWPGLIIDPSAASFRIELINRGLFVTDAANDVLPGIQLVSSMLAQKRLKIHKRCENLKRELETYAWDEHKAEKGKEEPIKANDHAADALRYYCATRINSWRLMAKAA